MPAQQLTFLQSNLNSDLQLCSTLSEVQRLINSYQSDVVKFLFRDPYEIFDYVSSLPYVTDRDSCGFDECLKRPAATDLSGGDCDDKTIFSAAAFALLNIPYRLVLTSYRADKELQHIYLEVYWNNSWKPFDPTYSTNQIFTEKPYTRKVYGDDLMKFYMHNGIPTLEGTTIDSVTQSANDWTATFQNVVGAGNLQSIAQGVASSSIVKTASLAVQSFIPIPGVGMVFGAVAGWVANALGIKGSYPTHGHHKRVHICLQNS